MDCSQGSCGGFDFDNVGISDSLEDCHCLIVSRPMLFIEKMA